MFSFTAILARHENLHMLTLPAIEGMNRRMPVLAIIVASTRPGRAGLPVGEWFTAEARRHGGFEIEVLDLAAIALPFLDEPHHPRLRRYQHEHTKAWSRRINAADAIALIAPEYNYGYTAPLKNALDYLFHEWCYKPVGFVSYGGKVGGTRSVQMLKQVVTTLKMMPIPEAVTIPNIGAWFVDGRFTPNDDLGAQAQGLLDELARWEKALRPLREAVRASL